MSLLKGRAEGNREVGGDKVSLQLQGCRENFMIRPRLACAAHCVLRFRIWFILKGSIYRMLEQTLNQVQCLEENTQDWHRDSNDHFRSSKILAIWWISQASGTVVVEWRAGSVRAGDYRSIAFNALRLHKAFGVWLGQLKRRHDFLCSPVASLCYVELYKSSILTVIPSSSVA